MKKPFKNIIVALTGWMIATSALAFGDKPVKLIVPAPPGGSMDIVAHVIKQPFDPLKDVVPLAVVGRSGLVLVANANNPARDFAGLIQHLKGLKGKASYATYSAGTVSHYAGEILSDQEGLDMPHVPFAGSPPALQAILGGHVETMFDGMLTSVPQIKAGKLRAYAFTGPKRSRHLPDVPSVTELGYPQLQFVGWLGVIGSAKLPAAEVAKVQAAFKQAASAPGVVQKLSDAGLEPEANIDTPALSREIRELHERYGAIVKKYGIKL